MLSLTLVPGKASKTEQITSNSVAASHQNLETIHFMWLLLLLPNLPQVCIIIGEGLLLLVKKMCNFHCIIEHILHGAIVGK